MGYHRSAQHTRTATPEDSGALGQGGPAGHDIVHQHHRPAPQAHAALEAKSTADGLCPAPAVAAFLGGASSSCSAAPSPERGHGTGQTVAGSQYTFPAGRAGPLRTAGSLRTPEPLHLGGTAGLTQQFLDRNKSSAAGPRPASRHGNEQDAGRQPHQNAVQRRPQRRKQDAAVRALGLKDDGGSDAAVTPGGNDGRGCARRQDVQVCQIVHGLGHHQGVTQPSSARATQQSPARPTSHALGRVQRLAEFSTRLTPPFARRTKPHGVGHRTRGAPRPTPLRAALASAAFRAHPLSLSAITRCDPAASTTVGDTPTNAPRRRM